METNSTDLDLVWGASAIANLIGRSRRQTYQMLDKGLIPARRIGGRWVAERGQLIRFFTEGETA